MRVLVINLARQTKRLEFQSEQFTRLGLTMERLSAVSSDDSRVRSDATYWDSWQRPLSHSERACLLSHRNAWEITLASNRPCLILEDDAVLSPDIAALLKALESLPGMDHVTLEFRHRKKLLGRQSDPLWPGRTLRRLYLDRTGAAAYVLWPSGAQKLLKLADVRCGLADGLICECPGLKSYQIEPAAAFQIDQCHKLGLIPPVDTHSSISPSQQSLPARHWRHRWRRLVAQLRMGWLQLSHCIQAQRRHVQVIADSFLLPRA